MRIGDDAAAERPALDLGAAAALSGRAHDVSRPAVSAARQSAWARRSLAGWLGLAVLFGGPQAQAQAPAIPTMDASLAVQFVKSSINEMRSVITGTSLGENERRNKINDKLRDKLNLARITIALLGEKRRLVPSERITEVQNLLPPYTTSIYSSNIQRYINNGVVIQVNNASGTDRAGEYTVSEKIPTLGQEEGSLEWRVQIVSGKSYFLDLAIGGVSLIRTRRADIQSKLQTDKGTEEHITYLQGFR
jgi:ABC-type transporter MlaC component